MKTRIEAVAEFTLPEWVILAIEYGVEDHITDKEAELLEDFCAVLYDKYGLGHFSFGDDIEFTRFNDLDNLGGDTVKAVYYAEATQ